MSATLRRSLFAIPLWLCVAVAQAGIAAGDTSPDLLGKTRAGDVIHVSDMHGKVVVVAFWASWCKYCRKELPILAGLQKLVSSEQLQVVAVNVDDYDTFRKLSRALMKVAPNLIYTFDPGPVSKAYGANALPRTLLIDRDGKVAFIQVGYDDDSLNDMANEINRLLAKPAQPAAAPAP